jgi:hypothetical protein
MPAPDKITASPPLLTTFRSLVCPSYPNNALEKYNAINKIPGNFHMQLITFNLTTDS